jgi:hypothetical protein
MFAFDNDDLTLAGCNAGRRMCRDKRPAIVIELTNIICSGAVQTGGSRWS